MTEADDAAMRATLRRIEGKVDDTFDQATKTNGRVSRLEEQVNGHTVGGRVIPGLVEKVEAQGHVVDTVKAAIRVGKWLAGTFGAVALGLVGNLAAGMFG